MTWCFSYKQPLNDLNTARKVYRSILKLFVSGKKEFRQYLHFSWIIHCVKSVRILSYSGPYFPAFGLNTELNNSEYGPFLRGNQPVTNFPIKADLYFSIRQYNTC